MKPPVYIVRNFLFAFLIIWIGSVLLFSCKPKDTLSPRISFAEPPRLFYILGDTFELPLAEVLDNRDGILNERLEMTGTVHTDRIGLYPLNWTVEDEAGNKADTTLEIKVSLAKSSYHAVGYTAEDNCITGTFSYLLNLQDCNCEEELVHAINFGNFGPGVKIDVQLSGEFLEQITISDEKGGLFFNGAGYMDSVGQNIHLAWTVTDSMTTDECQSTWVRP